MKTHQKINPQIYPFQKVIHEQDSKGTQPSGELDTAIADITLSREDATSKILWYIYLPLGIMIAILRFGLLFLFFSLTNLLKIKGNKATNAVVLSILGVHIRYNLDQDKLSKRLSGSIGACNHVSVYDILCGLNLPDTSLLLAAPPEKVPNTIIHKIIGHMSGTAWDIYDRRKLVQHFQSWAENQYQEAVFVVPEKTINNGEGLFSFHPQFFNKAPKVVPVAVKINIPFGLHPHASHLSYQGRLFRLLALPWIRFQVAMLPPRIQQDNQTPEAFARQIQEDIAGYLAIPATRWTHVDKNEFMK